MDDKASCSLKFWCEADDNLASRLPPSPERIRDFTAYQDPPVVFIELEVLRHALKSFARPSEGDSLELFGCLKWEIRIWV